MRPARVVLAALAACGTAACADEKITIEPGTSPAGATHLSADPGLAIDPETGDLLASWIENDGAGWRLYVARSADGARSWSAPAAVTRDSGEVHPHGEAAPRLVAGTEDRLAIVWSRDTKVAGREWPASDIRLARSADGGRTWLTTATLNDDTASAPGGHTFHGAAWAGDSGLVAAWLDERRDPRSAAVTPAPRAHGDEPDATIYVVSSPDFGRSWTANRPAWGAACPCCRVSLAREAGGNVVAAWRRHFGGDVRDVVTAPLAAEAVPPARVHADGWVYRGCPHTGPALAGDPVEGSHVVWYTGAAGRTGVYYARVGGGGGAAATPTPLIRAPAAGPAHPAVATLPGGGAVAAYDLAENGARAIGVAHISAEGKVIARRMVPQSAGGAYPQVVATGSVSAAVAWTAAEGKDSAVRLARVVFH